MDINQPIVTTNDTDEIYKLPEIECSFVRFWKEQQKLPPARRSRAAMLTCFCSKCRMTM